MSKEGKIQLRVTLFTMIMLLSMFFVFNSMPLITTDSLASSVDSISSYWHNAVSEVYVHATVNFGIVENVALYYRWSINNVSWNSWQKWIGVNNPDYGSNTTVKLYAWTFNCPNKTGYYEFYSIASYNGIFEASPRVADARCHVNYSYVTRFGCIYIGHQPDALYYPSHHSSVLLGSNFNCPSDGVADNMTIFISNHDFSTNITCAIYTCDGGTLVGVTEEKNVGIVQGWVTFDFIGMPLLVADNEYYLVAWGDGGYLRYDNNNSHTIVGKYLDYTGIFPNDIGDLAYFDSFVLSLYCRYTES